MAKSKRKKTKGAISAKKSREAANGRMKAAEYVNHLLELHKLQGALLKQLSKEV